LGDGVPKLALGGPPGGSPGPTRHRAPILFRKPRKTALGGSWGAPGGPRGGLCGAQGASGGVRGPLPGGYPPGGPLVAALPTDNTALLEQPPRGAPQGQLRDPGPQLGAIPREATRGQVLDLLNAKGHT
jgi:hypothetical protein